LLDAHGTIEPIDLTSMERVFKDLEADKKVRVSGVHWASLINAYGCVSKNLDRAIQIFESVSSHPDAKYAHERLPDAVTFEALVGALVVNRRMDLLPSYLTQLEASGTHMTAYIANAIIRGHAASGDLDAARTVFEGMADPPVGVAAPNNHAPHVGKQQQQQQAVSSDAPVYREPSTWEVMLRAELGGGHRENALELLERLKHRFVFTSCSLSIADSNVV
jgi:pentatricopeptide repeat protein